MTLPSALRSAATLALAGALLSCARPHEGVTDARFFGSISPPRANVLRFNNGTEPETIDPALLSGQPDGRAAMLLFEGLTTRDPQTLEPRPAQAYRWEVAADGLTYTFHLRPGVAWSDGAAVTAGDFVYSWRRALSPATGSRAAGLLYPIANAERFNKGELADSTRIGVRAGDDSTLVVTLGEPTPYFLFLTGDPSLLPVPRRTLERWGGAWTEPGRAVGNGPFLLTRHVQGERMEFVRNARYWDAAGVKLDGVVAYAVDDMNTSTSLYKAGELDWSPSGYIPAPFLPYLQGYADYTSGEYQGTYFYSVNTTRKPFDNVHVRRALSLAIDRETIARDLLKGSRRAWGRITPSGYPGYDPPAPVGFDPAAARHELALAGFPDGRGFPRFAILFNTSEDSRRIGEAVQAMWSRELHVAAGLENQEFASYLEATTHLRYAVAKRTWLGDYLDPNTFLEPLRAGDGNNRTGWADPRYDALLHQAAGTLDARARFALLREAEARALDAAVFLPVYHFATHELIKPYVRGLHPNALDFHPLTRVWLDREWRRHEPVAGSKARP